MCSPRMEILDIIKRGKLKKLAIQPRIMKIRLMKNHWQKKKVNKPQNHKSEEES